MKNILTLCALLSLFLGFGATQAASPPLELDASVGIYSTTLEQITEVSEGQQVSLIFFFTPLADLALPPHLLRDRVLNITFTLQGALELQETVTLEINRTTIDNSYQAISYTVPEDVDGESFTFIGEASLQGVPMKNSQAEGFFRVPSALPLVRQPDMETKLVASDAKGAAFFGGSVSISGNTVVVGAKGDDGNKGELYRNHGAAYFYEQDAAGTWNQTSKFAQGGPSLLDSDSLGHSVSISGDYVMVGEPGWETSDQDYCIGQGIAYILGTNSEDNWTEVASMSYSGSCDYGFGKTVSLSGSYAMAARGYSGEADIYEHELTGSWSNVATLTPSGPNTFTAEVGTPMALSGNYAIIGAYSDQDAGSDSGAAYIFERDANGTWSEVSKLTASDPVSDALFGCAVAISGNYAIIGAYGYDNAASGGAAYIFERDANGAWSEVSKVMASPPATGSSFGQAVAIDNKQAVVGAYDDEGGGILYIYSRGASDGQWRETRKLRASDTIKGDGLGYSVAISEGYALAGAPYEGSVNLEWGAAYIFNLLPDNDGDGYSTALDCNDSDSAINPGTLEICGDSIDQNCDGSFNDEECASGPSISIDSLSIDDDLLGQSSGNSNGLAEAGEIVELRVTLKNTGYLPAADVSASLSSSDQSVMITRAYTEYGDIGAMSTGICPCDFTFRFEVDPSVDNGHLVPFTLEVVAQGVSWRENFSLIMHNDDQEGVPGFGGISKFSPDTRAYTYGEHVAIDGSTAIIADQQDGMHLFELLKTEK